MLRPKEMFKHDRTRDIQKNEEWEWVIVLGF
jgi:hypothetical protein